jgi:UDP-N-acetylglucosamine transferase subunit ALG13
VIFATVGTQEPFERMIGALDRWADRNATIQVFAQIGKGRPPRRIRWVDFLAPGAFRDAVERAEVVVAHAGMGTLLEALELGKPIIVMPRRAQHGEHRNDHQLATAERFCGRRGIRVVHDGEELERVLDDLHNVIPAGRIREHASGDLIRSVREFIEASGANPVSDPGRRRP